MFIYVCVCMCVCPYTYVDYCNPITLAQVLSMATLLSCIFIQGASINC